MVFPSPVWGSSATTAWPSNNQHSWQNRRVIWQRWHWHGTFREHVSYFWHLLASFDMFWPQPNWQGIEHWQISATDLARSMARYYEVNAVDRTKGQTLCAFCRHCQNCPIWLTFHKDFTKISQRFHKDFTKISQRFHKDFTKASCLAEAPLALEVLAGAGISRKFHNYTSPSPWRDAYWDILDHHGQ